MKKVWALMLAAGLWAVVSGCYTMAGPNWYCPGPAGLQQTRAERFDPYPENESGPTIVGARPREFERPVPEVDRARWNTVQNWRGSRFLPWNWGR